MLGFRSLDRRLGGPQCSTFSTEINFASLASQANSGSPNIRPTSLVKYLYAMKTRIISMAGIAFCSLFITTIATLGQTVTVPAGQTTVITQVPAPPTVNTFVKALDNDRYQLIQKSDNKEVYRDTQTGEKWILEIHHRNG
jgi:hypothetical protein